MTKKIILSLVGAGALALTMAMSASGCGGSSNNGNGGGGGTTGGGGGTTAGGGGSGSADMGWTCVQNPTTSADILNGCAPSTVQSVDIEPFYPTKAPGGQLPALQ